MMERDEASRVRALGEIAAEFDLDAIRVRTGDTEIEIVRREAGPAPVVAYPAAPAAVPAGPIAPSRSDGGPVPAPPPSNVHRVTAPVVGVFYRAASPGAEPFVDVGSRVSAGQTLCILEAMKLMNEIASDHAGTVTRVLVENGELVSLGQELFWIEP